MIIFISFSERKFWNKILNNNDAVGKLDSEIPKNKRFLF